MTEYKPKNLMNLGLDLDRLAKEDDEPTLAATGSDEGPAGGLELASDEDDGMNETGVRENPVDEMLADTGTPGAGVPTLTATEEFTLTLKAAFDKSVKLGQELLRDDKLSLRERIDAINVVTADLDMQLDKDAIKSDTERTVAGRGTKTALLRMLEYSLQRLCIEPANATPSTLPERIKGVSDTELERMALGLGELELKAVTDEGKKEAKSLLAIVAGDKARRVATGPTQAISITPVPPKGAMHDVIVPPAPISGAWQSGPEVQHNDQNKIVTQDASTTAEPPKTPEPSVVVSPSMEAQMKSEEKKDEKPAESKLRVLRIGRGIANDMILQDRNVSIRHAEVTLLPDNTLKVVDLGSINGTFINDARIAPEGIAAIGQRIRFAVCEFLVTQDAQGLPFLSPTSTDKPTGHTAGFMAKGEEMSEANRAEQAKLDAVDAASGKKPVARSAEEIDAEVAAKKSATLFERELTGKKSDDKKSSGWRMVGIGALALCVGACLIFSVGVGIYGVAHNLPGLPPTAEGTRQPKPPTDHATEVAETSTPTETPDVEASTATPTVVATETETSTGYDCRPGSTVTGCNRVEDFLLARAGGEAYWDCSGMDPDAYRDIYTVDDPTGTSRRVVANTCACQLCEPTATP